MVFRPTGTSVLRLILATLTSSLYSLRLLLPFKHGIKRRKRSGIRQFPLMITTTHAPLLDISSTTRVVYFHKRTNVFEHAVSDTHFIGSPTIAG
jgi:hypothetical protein